MASELTDADVALAKPRELLEAIGEFALAVKPHHMDVDQRERIRRALVVLIDHVLAQAALTAAAKGGQDAN